jgi:hypothetical protein
VSIPLTDQMEDAMSDMIRVFAQVGDNPPSPLGEVELDDADGVATLRATTTLLRKIADVMDDITTLHEVNDHLDNLFR